MSDSSSDEDIKVKSKKKRGRPLSRPKVKEKTPFRCRFCGEEFGTKCLAYKHTKDCEKNNLKTLNKCVWCGLQFANRGNLASHAFHIHGDSSYKSLEQPKAVHPCLVCNTSFFTYARLKHHIRGAHFNLTATLPAALDKEINQVWFEKVLNSNEILEIKKAGHNCLMMRRLDRAPPPAALSPPGETIDLRQRYLSQRSAKDTERMPCPHCSKSYLKRDIKKHVEEVHLNRKKHRCNNCQRLFKRAYQYLQHHCARSRPPRAPRHPAAPPAAPPDPRARRPYVRGVRHSMASDLCIVSVESLGMPLG